MVRKPPSIFIIFLGLLFGVCVEYALVNPLIKNDILEDRFFSQEPTPSPMAQHVLGTIRAIEFSGKFVLLESRIPYAPNTTRLIRIELNDKTRFIQTTSVLAKHNENQDLRSTNVSGMYIERDGIILSVGSAVVIRLNRGTLLALQVALA